MYFQPNILETTVPIDSLMDKVTGLREPVMGTNTMGSYVTHHINLDGEGRDSLLNVRLELHTYMAACLRRLHCILKFLFL
jgi:hypothetical protein